MRPGFFVFGAVFPEPCPQVSHSKGEGGCFSDFPEILDVRCQKKLWAKLGDRRQAGGMGGIAHQEG
jgi:hypothetical protein